MEEMGSGRDVQRGNEEQERPCGEVREGREKAKSHLGQNTRKEDVRNKICEAKQNGRKGRRIKET